MLRWRVWSTFLLSLQSVTANQQPLNTHDKQIEATLSEQWSVLGPFQIGTREAPWGADPLEYHNGFHNLAYNANATFRSSIATNGTVGWSNHTATISHPDANHAIVELSVAFPELEEDWKFLQSVYGWAALHWQGWARGEIFIHPESAGRPFVLHAEGILEFWIDGVRYFGGDFYGYGRAPVTLRLESGAHRVDVRLVRDVRASGAVGAPTVDVKLRLERSSGGLSLLYGYGKNVLMSEVIGGAFGPLTSPYASITMRNDAESDIYVHGIEGMEDKCVFEMLSSELIKLVPGQTRQIGFKIACTPSYDKRLQLKIMHTIDGLAGMYTLSTSTWPKIIDSKTDPHRVTFKHPSGIISYAILRPPSPSNTCGKPANTSLPVLLALHGAGLEASSPLVRHALDALPDLCAWVLFPTGATPWSGDDWHIWGWADVEAAVAMIPDWIRQVEWSGPGVDVGRWLVMGHSNGGQGTWYALTHHFDKVVAAAPLSGYSSIENYVPYTFWRTADPGRMAVVHAAMSSYRHELLLENAKGIPVLQQHGGADDNVPVYHSRLMSQRISEAGAESEYFEMEGEPHYWDGAMTTPQLSDFFNEHLHQSAAAGESPRLGSFSMVVANPAETGLKFGIKVIHLRDSGHLGRIDVTYDQLSGSCSFHISNILMWMMPQDFQQCRTLSIDRQGISMDILSTGEKVWLSDGRSWTLHESVENAAATTVAPMRDESQLGHMDAILRTNGAFNIVRQTPETAHVALQVSRNFCQYFAADTQITDNYTAAIHSAGNIISLATGPSLAGPDGHPIEIRDDEIIIHLDSPHILVYKEVNDYGLGAIFIRPLPLGRLEVVVWGRDVRSLEIATRFVPMMTGSGQPDFVIVDKRMLWKGVEGARAMVFFDAWWNVTPSSYLS